MTFLKRFKERSERNRDISRLWGVIHDQESALTDARLERDWWQNLAISAQLEAEQYKNIVRDLKS